MMLPEVLARTLSFAATIRPSFAASIIENPAGRLSNTGRKRLLQTTTKVDSLKHLDIGTTNLSTG